MLSAIHCGQKKWHFFMQPFVEKKNRGRGPAKQNLLVVKYPGQITPSGEAAMNDIVHPQSSDGSYECHGPCEWNTMGGQNEG